jgi:hypothetical protein
MERGGGGGGLEQGKENIASRRVEHRLLKARFIKLSTLVGMPFSAGLYGVRCEKTSLHYCTYNLQ